MKDQYDFAGAERGKFHHKDAEMVPPLRLESDADQGGARSAKNSEAGPTPETNS